MPNSLAIFGKFFGYILTPLCSSVVLITRTSMAKLKWFTIRLATCCDVWLVIKPRIGIWLSLRLSFPSTTSLIALSVVPRLLSCTQRFSINMWTSWLLQNCATNQSLIWLIKLFRFIEMLPSNWRKQMLNTGSVWIATIVRRSLKRVIWS